jgi:hypothetical protein
MSRQKWRQARAGMQSLTRVIASGRSGVFPGGWFKPTEEGQTHRLRIAYLDDTCGRRSHAASAKRKLDHELPATSFIVPGTPQGIRLRGAAAIGQETEFDISGCVPPQPP